MAGAVIELDVSELQALNRTLIAGLAGLLQAAQEQLLTDVGVELEGQTKDRFGERQGPDGSAWKPWSPVTKRLRRGSGGGLLERGGELRESITHVVAGDELRVGSNKVYAAVHQFGHTFEQPTAFGTPTIPARPYLGISERDRGELGMLIEDFLKEYGGGVAA